MHTEEASATTGIGLPPIFDLSVKSSFFILASLTFILFIFSTMKSKSTNAPILNPKEPFELTSSRAKTVFVHNAPSMVKTWFKANPDKPVRVLGDMGEVTILPSKMAHEIRNDERFSFAGYVRNMFFCTYPGFEGFREGGSESRILQDVILRDLTKYLNKVTEPLAEETCMTLPELFTRNTEWHTINLRQSILPLVARISSRVFLGEQACRNEAWLKITREYTVNVFQAAHDLRQWPALMQWIVHWALPSCRMARSQVAEARQIIRSIVEERRQLRRNCEQESKTQPKFDDAIDWFEQNAKGRPYDPLVAQLTLSLAAIHTTSDLICQTLINLAQNPEMIKPLREEIVRVLGEGGWKKTSLYNLKLMDSVIKESQRLKPISSITMQRQAVEDVKLSDGTFIPKNALLVVGSHYQMLDPINHQDPETWDGYRFYNMREIPGKQNIAQLVTTSPDHLAFGHGQHACPGRFFAANEIKVVLIHVLMMYDWKIPPDVKPKVYSKGFGLSADLFLDIQVRKRQEEIAFMV